MFVITKEKKKLNILDATADIVAIAISERSIKPLAGIFRKGYYGSRLNLKGSYLDSMKYRQRERRYKQYTIT